MSDFGEFGEKRCYKVGEFERLDEAWDQAIEFFKGLVSDDVLTEKIKADMCAMADASLTKEIVRFELVYRWLSSLGGIKDWSLPTVLNEEFLPPAAALLPFEKAPTKEALCNRLWMHLSPESTSKVYDAFVAAVRAKVDESGELEVYSFPPTKIKKVADNQYALVF